MDELDRLGLTFEMSLSALASVSGAYVQRGDGLLDACTVSVQRKREACSYGHNT